MAGVLLPLRDRPVPVTMRTTEATITGVEIAWTAGVAPRRHSDPRVIGSVFWRPLST